MQALCFFTIPPSLAEHEEGDLVAANVQLLGLDPEDIQVLRSTPICKRSELTPAVLIQLPLIIIGFRLERVSPRLCPKHDGVSGLPQR